MLSKSLLTLVLGLILSTSSIMANEQFNPVLLKTTSDNISLDYHEELLFLQDDLKARRDSAKRPSKEKQTLEAAYPSTACDPFPLPTVPIGPSTTLDIDANGDQFFWTFWRYPCNEEFAWIVFTIEPKTSEDRPFICSGQITIIQGGLEEDSLKLCSDPIDESCSSKCGDVITKSSYVLTKYSFVTSERIDLNKGFYLDWDLSSTIIQMDIPAYDPTDYEFGEPMLKNQLAVNGLFWDPNKPGHGFDINLTEYGLLFYYYGHSKNGERLWLISDLYDGSVEYGVPISLSLNEVVNGVFGDPIQQETKWGDMTFTLTDCDNGVAVLEGIDGGFSLNVVRLAGLKDVECNQTSLGLE